jgi:hypothetical protein
VAEEIDAQALLRDLLKPGEPLRVLKFYVDPSNKMTTVDFFLVAVDSARAANKESYGYTSKVNFECRFRFYFNPVMPNEDVGEIYDHITKAVQKFMLTGDEAKERGVQVAAAEEAKKNVTIEPGMSKDEVIKILGEPLKTISFGEKTMLKYDDMVVELREGKVVDVKSN